MRRASRVISLLMAAGVVAGIAAASSADARWPQIGVRADRVIDESRVTGELTEVAMRTWAIAIGGPPNNNLLNQPQFDKLREQCRTSHVRIDGFRIRHLANFSRNTAIQIRGLCSYILVENCDVQWVNYGGINVADGEHVILRNNVASNCGVQGMGSGGTSHLLFENNLLDDNNYISSSSDGRIYNNIVAANVGGGLNYGGSFDRPHTAGQARNRCWANLAFDNAHRATVLRQEDDRHERTFGNLMEGNLFVAARGEPPLRIGGKGATADEFEAYNTGAANVYASGPIFRDPDHFDFTLTRPELAAEVGFDSSRLRLDWSEFYVRASDAQSKSVRKGLEFVPIDLAASFNRGLTDDVAGDGRGGWTDQGPRDLRHLPVGRQRFDGVPYDLGTRERGAVLLKNRHVKPGPFPDTVTVPVDNALAEAYLLYAAVGAGKAPAAPARRSDRRRG